jgi:DNA-binding CsgD family transcriptional regulator
MARSSRRSAEAHFKQLCLSGLNARLMMSELLGVLHGIVPWTNCGVFWADDQGQIANAYLAHIGNEALVHGFFDYLPRIQGTLMMHFGEMLAIPGPVFPLEQMLRVERGVFERHEFYQELCIPLCIEQTLHVTLRSGRETVGILAPTRTRSEPPFVGEETHALARLAPLLAHALLAQESFHGPWTDGPEQGLVILSREGSVQHVSQTARRLLYYLHRPSPPAGPAYTIKPSNIAVFQEQLFRKFAECMRGPSAHVPVFSLENGWGRLTLRTYWLDPAGGEGEGLIGVIVQRQEPLSLKLIRALSTTTLSMREREIALQMCLGDSYPDIAKKFHLSHRTVVAHSQNILNKLGIDKRTDLRPLLLYGSSTENTLCSKVVFEDDNGADPLLPAVHGQG